MKATDTIEPVLAALRELGCNTGALEAAGAYTIRRPGHARDRGGRRRLLERLNAAAIAIAYSSMRHHDEDGAEGPGGSGRP